MNSAIDRMRFRDLPCGSENNDGAARCDFRETEPRFQRAGIKARLDHFIVRGIDVSLCDLAAQEEVGIVPKGIKVSHAANDRRNALASKIFVSDSGVRVNCYIVLQWPNGSDHRVNTLHHFLEDLCRVHLASIALFGLDERVRWNRGRVLKLRHSGDFQAGVAICFLV